MIKSYCGRGSQSLRGNSLPLRAVARLLQRRVWNAWHIFTRSQTQHAHRWVISRQARWNVGCLIWRSMSAKIQLLNFACIFGIRCCSFTICTYICNWTFKFPISLLQLSIWHCWFHDSTFKFTQFNIQVYAIQHSTFKDTCFRYPTASQSMTFSVGSANYQNSPLLGASKGRSLYPR